MVKLNTFINGKIKKYHTVETVQKGTFTAWHLHFNKCWAVNLGFILKKNKKTTWNDVSKNYATYCIFIFHWI